MFEHSVKVPRHYKVAANILKKVSTEGGSVKTLLYDDKLRHFKTNVLFALITETIKHAADIDKVFEHCNIFNTETRLDPWLAKVLTTELLFGKKTLPGKSKPEQTILSYRENFEKYISEHQDDLKNEATPRPRYVRINTNLYTTSDAIRAFQDEGYRFIRCTSGSYDDYLQQIQNLTEYDFTQDYHVKTMFVFSPGTKWHDHDLYLESKIILQDKATAMAVHLLAPPAGSVVVDMCAAPGMKTTQLAAYMRNEGKIYAVERNEKRYNTLCEFVEKTGCKCVQTFHKDALEMKRGEYDDVEYILLDPSCSGSGMDFCVHNYIEDTRLAKLTSLQEKFLKHAMNAFPKAKRIVYSTCSLFPEENERVITNVVKTSRAKWRVQDVKELLKGQWNNFGSAMYGSMGTRCMYAKPDSDLTIGFFLAVLDRDEKDLAKANKVKEDANTELIEKDSVSNAEIEGNYENENVNGNTDVIKKKKKKKDKTNSEPEEIINEQGIENTSDDVDYVSKKKKKKKRSKTENLDDDTKNVKNTKPSKKKKYTDTIVSEATNENVPADTTVSEATTENVPVDTTVTKLKKKKHSSDENFENNTNEPSEIDLKEKKSKKKKKRKHRDSEDIQENGGNTVDVDQDIEMSEKKKRKEQSSLTQEQV